ncbi:hypothetical protein Leryth_027156 [Lithospermum erythrorhizon]|nr:hypothetical protein Leryth_027156 [Lithospermum erythrorhizon]
MSNRVLLAKRKIKDQIVASCAIRSDVISNLPINVTEAILMKLPTRDAVRTSILSRRWRFIWTKLPQFIFDEAMWNQLEVEHSVHITVTMILYQLLSSHEGPMSKFTLSVPGLDSCPEIDNLILFLSRNHVEDFTLEMWEDEYLLPSSIFKCQELRHLKLWSCRIRTPPLFKGFCRLTSLKLIDVTISAEALRHFISSSPLLELLELKSIICIDLYIDATNLRTFRFHGFTNSMIFKRVPLLASVSILQEDESTGTIDFKGVGCNLAKFFDCFTFLEYLHLNYQIIQSLAVVDLQTTLVHLKHLKLSSICFNKMVEVSFILSLLRSSPNLKSIKIKFRDAPFSDSKKTTTYMEGQDYSDIHLSRLTQVKLDCFTGTKPEMEFTRLLLAKSSSLERLRIKPGKVVLDNGCKILKEVTKFRRLSKEAEVIYVG